MCGILFIGPILVNDMQTRPNVKESRNFCDPKSGAMLRMKNQFSEFCDFQFLRYGRSKFLESV